MGASAETMAGLRFRLSWCVHSARARCDTPVFIASLSPGTVARLHVVEFFGVLRATRGGRLSCVADLVRPAATGMCRRVSLEYANLDRRCVGICGVLRLVCAAQEWKLADGGREPQH